MPIHETSNNTTEKAILPLAIENIQKKHSLWNPLESNSNEIKRMIYLVESAFRKMQIEDTHHQICCKTTFLTVEKEYFI